MDKRTQAFTIFKAGVAAADPAAAVARHIDGVVPPALIVAVGKAGCAMMQAALAVFPGSDAIVVTNPENAQDVAGARVMVAAHPVPDAGGLAAGQHVLAALASVKGPVLALISGGGSALLPAPKAPVTLADKAELNRILLRAGLDITAMNLIRQQVSDLKGGGFLRAAAPQPVTALILSDVVGDALAAIASGPTVAPLGTSKEAENLLKTHGLWDVVPDSVRVVLQRGDRTAGLPDARNILVGSNALSVAAMAAVAPDARVLAPVVGDVAEAAQVICDGAQAGITLWGGETTVRLKGCGRGGRNQELALRIAVEAAARGWGAFVCLQGGTDGRDGPTDAAGGLVDGGTLARIAAAGGDVAALLQNNDSYQALGLAGDLLMTGGTGTNVADLGILIRG